MLVSGALDALRCASNARGEEIDTSSRSEQAIGSLAPAPTLTFFGDAAVIAPLLEGTPHEVVHVPRRLEVEDSLRETLRGTTASSIRAAIGTLASGGADAVVSAGSTGALVALSRHLVGLLPGVRRPAIVKTLGAADGGRFRMLDLGANIGSSAEQLHQFALMASAAAVGDGQQEHRGDRRRSPSVGLLNIGSEVSKGPPEVRAAARLLDADDRVHYAGFVEPHQLFDGVTDIVVTDGFAGNIALKASEGAAQMARHLLAKELADASPGVALAKAMLHKRLDRVRDAYNPQTYNGASLLGVAGVVVKSHGGADRTGYASAVRQAMDALATGSVDRVAAGVQ